MYRVIALVLAMLCFLIAALLGFDVLIHGSHLLGWLGIGSFFFATAHLPLPPGP